MKYEHDGEGVDDGEERFGQRRDDLQHSLSLLPLSLCLLISVSVSVSLSVYLSLFFMIKKNFSTKIHFFSTSV